MFYMPFRIIADTLGVAPTTVYRIVNEPETPRPRRRLLEYGSPVKQKLINFFQTHGKEARQMTYTELAFAIDTPASTSTIRRLLHKAGYRRCVAQQKPPLSQRQKQQRLDFCLRVRHFTIEDWMRVIWTDESAFHRGGHQRIWVTRRPDERYHPDCILPKYKNIPHTMIWGSLMPALWGV